MAGFGLDMGSLLRRKYDIAQQEADARTIGAQRDLVAPLPNSNNVQSLGGAGAGVAAGTGPAEPVVNPLEQDLLKARIAAANAESRNFTSQISARDEAALSDKKFGNRNYDSKTPDPVQSRVAAWQLANPGVPVPPEVINGTAPGMRRGMTKVPGKGTKDNFPAMLAPGEAVLNAKASKILGRGLIAALNAVGNRNGAMKKGLV